MAPTVTRFPIDQNVDGALRTIDDRQTLDPDVIRLADQRCRRGASFLIGFGWNDHTKLIFPNGFMKLPLTPHEAGTFRNRTPDYTSAGQLRPLSGDKLSDLRNG